MPSFLPCLWGEKFPLRGKNPAQRTVASSVLCFAILAVFTHSSSTAARTPKVKAKQPPTTAAPSIAPKQLVEATRAAAQIDANRFGARMGTPVCPSGSKVSSAVVQCLVTLGDTTIGYLVRPIGFTYFAELTFPLVSVASIEATLRPTVDPNSRINCGRHTFLVMPVHSTTTCTISGSQSTQNRKVRLLNAKGELQAVEGSA